LMRPSDLSPVYSAQDGVSAIYFHPPPHQKVTSKTQVSSIIGALQLEMLARGRGRCKLLPEDSKLKSGKRINKLGNALARPLWATFGMMSLWLLVTGPCGTISVNEL
ncbi:MAG: hypothetical protein PUG01_00445, partial [Collinsella sp.]|nr:hypothetical protein [Collinsella sp.]